LRANVAASPPQLATVLVGLRLTAAWRNSVCQRFHLFHPKLRQAAATLPASGGSAVGKRSIRRIWNKSFKKMEKNILCERTKKLLVMQGFSKHEVDYNPNILALTKWTPLLCGIFGLIGVLLGSPYYLIALGILTLIGAFRPYSFYDYLYKYVFKAIFNFGDAVPHGIQRKIGCGIGGVVFSVSGLGFCLDIMPLAYIPSCFMVTFAFIAGISNWCFVSTFYELVSGKTQKKCC
jgi:hypothetical protein